MPFLTFNQQFKFLLAPAIFSIATSGLIFMQMYLVPAITSLHSRLIFQVLGYLLHFLCFLSFYRAINIKNNPPQLIFPRLKHQIRNSHPLYTERKVCLKENSRFKPPRCSHCSKCNCVARMDHHCPYINNCLGLKNLKAFLLFTGYGGLFAFLFLLLSCNMYLNIQNQLFPPMEEREATVWIILICIAIFLSFSMLGLAISNFYLASKNITTMDMMKGHFRISDPFGTHPNPFDLTFLTNINYIFQSDKWLFWLPTQITTYNDGSSYPMRKPIYGQDIATLSPEVQNALKDPFVEQLPKSISELRKKHQDEYKNVIFFYLGEQYRLGSLKEEAQQIQKNEGQQKPKKVEDQAILKEVYDQ